MRVEFDLASLSGPMLETFRLAVTALDKEIPVLAGKIQEWPAEKKSKGTGYGAAAAPRKRTRVRPGGADVVTFELERVELEVAAAAATAAKLQTAGTHRFEAPPRPLFLFSS